MKYFDKITSLNDILINYLDPSLKIDKCSLEEFEPDDLMSIGFCIKPEDTDQADFIAYFIKPALKTMCEYCNKPGNIEVCMPPKIVGVDDALEEEVFYDDILPLHIITREKICDNDICLSVAVMTLMKF